MSVGILRLVSTCQILGPVEEFGAASVRARVAQPELHARLQPGEGLSVGSSAAARILDRRKIAIDVVRRFRRCRE